MKSGIVVISELTGELRQRVLDVQRRFDPKLAGLLPPHVTITGSSGMGPIASGTTVEELQRALEPIAHSTTPMELPLLPPMKFMQKTVIVVPLDPNGPLRTLHERIKSSGLLYERERYSFTPHITLSLFPELDPRALAELMAQRIGATVRITHIQCVRAVSTRSGRLLELPLQGIPPTVGGIA